MLGGIVSAVLLLMGSTSAASEIFSSSELEQIQGSYQNIEALNFTDIPVKRYTVLGGSSVPATGFVLHQDLVTGEFFIRQSSVRKNNSGGLWVKGSMSRVHELRPNLKQFAFFQRESVYFGDTIWDYKTQCATEIRDENEYLICRVWRKRLNDVQYRLVYGTEI